MNIEDTMIKGTDRFLRSKRNLLFWLAATLLVEFTHSNVAIQPEIFGAALSVPPRVLTTILVAVSAYHAIAFYHERSVVIKRNNILSEEAQSISPDDLVKSRMDNIESFAFASSENVKATTEHVNELSSRTDEYTSQLQILQTNISNMTDTVTRAESYMLSIDALSIGEKQGVIGIVRNDISNLSGYFSGMLIATERLEETSRISRGIVNSIQNTHSADSSLMAVIETTLSDLNTWRRAITDDEKLMFNWYDTKAVTLLLSLAVSTWAYDLGPWPSPSTLLAKLPT